ncbi:hypothetical protein [Actinomadura kijaniata]|uniref:hypothetical protein n=1 Tax=Actinomadura kijaniata TaxID=46161 RepID=UPI0008352CAE|nr:hypothetical protein [Actinomadura kijaniata]
MRKQGANFGRKPVRVVLTGGPDGWRWTLFTEHGEPETGELPGQGVRWSGRGRRDEAPAWWRRRLAQDAEDLRELVGWKLTDRTFAELGVEAEITWFAVADPVEWEGLVTLRDPDPARFPGEVRPFVVTLEPGRGAVLPDDHLLFSTLAADAWATLGAVAGQVGTAPPRASFLCGWNDHRSVRVGRGALHVSTQVGGDGVERLGEVHGTRPAGWGGNPELRFRLDGIDLLDEPAADVVALLEGLGHEIERRHGHHLLRAMGLTLGGPDERGGRFTSVGLRLPDVLADAWR